MPFGGEKLDDDDEPKQVAEHKETPWAPVTDTDFLSVLPYAGLDDAEADEIFGSNKDRKQKLAKTRDQLHKEKKKQKNKYVLPCLRILFIFDCYEYFCFTDIPLSIIQIITMQIRYWMNR